MIEEIVQKIIEDHKEGRNPEEMAWTHSKTRKEVLMIIEAYETGTRCNRRGKDA